MIISSGRKFIFVHIPKTGGTALALALEARAMADDIMIGDTPKAVKRRGRLKGLQAAGRLWKHSTLADIEGIVPRAAFDDYFIVSLVRNPWDRLVSYYFWLRAQTFDHPAVGLAKSLPFADFLAHPQTQASLRANPYTSYMRDGAGAEHCSLYIRLENLEQDLQAFENHLGFKVDMPVANQSDRDRDWRKYYDESSLAVVADVCAEDIARFGYTFG